MKLVLPILALALALTGCHTAPEKPERIVYKFIKVPVELTQKTTLAAPPEVTVYSQLSWDKKEQALIDLVQEHVVTIGMCNARLYSVQDWSAKQSLIYEAAP